MTNDDELLEEAENVFHRLRSYDYEDCADFVIALATRIRELKAELAFYRGFHDGVCNTGTHVVVPVEMNTNMRSKAHEAYCDALTNRESVSIAELIDVSFAAATKAAQKGSQ